MRRKSVIPRRPDVLSVSDVAQELEVAETTVKRWIRGGHLAARKVGKVWWIRRKPYEEFKATYIRPIKPAPAQPPNDYRDFEATPAEAAS